MTAHRVLCGQTAEDRNREEAAVRIGSLVLVLWLVIGAFAAYQRGYLGGSGTASCAQLGTVLITIVAGPVNYFGANPKIDCQVPQPSP